MVYERRLGRALGRGHDLFAAVRPLASAGAAVWALSFPSAPSCLGEAAAQVLAVGEG
jgi:hypothetical protein